MQDFKYLRYTKETSMPSVWLSLAVGASHWAVCCAIMFGLGAAIMAGAL